MTSLDRGDSSTGGQRPFGTLEADRGSCTDRSDERPGGPFAARVTELTLPLKTEL